LHRNLGLVLQAQRDLAGAISNFRRAAALAPKDAHAHYHLGLALVAQGDEPSAIASYRRAVAADPEHPEAHCNLGILLLGQGEVRDALAAARIGHDLGSRRKDWPHPSAQLVKRCERFVELDDRLPAILKGEAQPTGTA